MAKNVCDRDPAGIGVQPPSDISGRSFDLARLLSTVSKDLWASHYRPIAVYGHLLERNASRPGVGIRRSIDAGRADAACGWAQREWAAAGGGQSVTPLSRQRNV